MINSNHIVFNDNEVIYLFDEIYLRKSQYLLGPPRYETIEYVNSKEKRIGMWHGGWHILPYGKDKIQCGECKKIFNISPKHLIFLAKLTLFNK